MKESKKATMLVFFFWNSLYTSKNGYEVLSSGYSFSFISGLYSSFMSWPHYEGDQIIRQGEGGNELSWINYLQEYPFSHNCCRHFYFYRLFRRYNMCHNLLEMCYKCNDSRKATYVLSLYFWKILSGPCGCAIQMHLEEQNLQQNKTKQKKKMQTLFTCIKFKMHIFSSVWENASMKWTVCFQLCVLI